MNKKEMKEWIYDNYNVPDNNNTLAPDMLDGILEYATYLEDEERFRFLSYVFPDLPASILREMKKKKNDKSHYTNVDNSLFTLRYLHLCKERKQHHVKQILLNFQRPRTKFRSEPICNRLCP